MKRILIADDDRAVIESLWNALKPYFDVDTAETASDVLDMFEQNEYSGLIIDVDFKHGANGLEIASRLRNRYRDLNIIVFSATDYSDAVRQQAVDIGADFYQKPLDRDIILRHMLEV